MGLKVPSGLDVRDLQSVTYGLRVSRRRTQTQRTEYGDHSVAEKTAH